MQLSARQQAFANTINYIQSNYEKDISLDDLASVACVSKFALIRIFKENGAGETPMNWVWSYRAQRAARFIATEPAKPITDVAAQTGFNSIQHFSRYFKKVFGLTASDYRKLNSQGVPNGQVLDQRPSL